MSTSDYDLAMQFNDQRPHTFNSLQHLTMRMADFSKHRNKKTWWGKNKARKSWVRFETEVENIITSMCLDEIIEQNASSDVVRDNIYQCVLVFSGAFPNWQDAYSFAEEFFVNSPGKANQLIEAVRR